MKTSGGKNVIGRSERFIEVVPSKRGAAVQTRAVGGGRRRGENEGGQERDRAERTLHRGGPVEKRCGVANACGRGAPQSSRAPPPPATPPAPRTAAPKRPHADAQSD